MDSLGGADIRFRSPQPVTSLCCKTMDMRLVHRVVCLSASQPKLVLIYCDSGVTEGQVNLEQEPVRTHTAPLPA